jgi:hypothetical protein
MRIWLEYDAVTLAVLVFGIAPLNGSHSAFERLPNPIRAWLGLAWLGLAGLAWL